MTEEKKSFTQKLAEKGHPKAETLEEKSSFHEDEMVAPTAAEIISVSCVASKKTSGPASPISINILLSLSIPMSEPSIFNLVAPYKYALKELLHPSDSLPIETRVILSLKAP